MPTQPRRNDSPKISLNLDTLEREADGIKEPFVVAFQGRPMTFSDPGDVDWQDLIRALSDPSSFFRTVLSQDDAKVFLAAKLASWKLNKLMSDYAEHYGIPTPGNAGASPR